MTCSSRRTQSSETGLDPYSDALHPGDYADGAVEDPGGAFVIVVPQLRHLVADPEHPAAASARREPTRTTTSLLARVIAVYSRLRCNIIHELAHEDAAIQRIAPAIAAATAFADAPVAPEPATGEVRAWARSQGITVPDRGKLRPGVWDAWRAAHHQ